jgi:diguanylate cyclase (GGDEF)-like protein/PAS domain S-box-containing protein
MPMMGRFDAFLKNDPLIYGFEISDPRIAGRIRAGQITAILRYTPFMLFANMMCALVMSIALVRSQPSMLVLLWSITLSGLLAFVYARWRRTVSAPRRNFASTRASIRAAGNAIILGSLWAIVPIAFFGSATEGTRIVIACVLIGMMCGGAFALAAIPVAAIAFALPIAIGSVIALVLYDLQFGVFLGFLLLVFGFVIFRATNTLASTLVERMLGEFELEKQRDMIGILLGEFEENGSDWMWETDSQFRLTYVSQGLLATSGRNPTELFGRRCVDALIGTISQLDEAQVTARNQMQDHFARRLPFREIECQVQVGKSRRWWSFAARPARDQNGKFTGFRGFARDITDKREKEAHIAYLARFDAVTGLPNRVLFAENLAAAIHNTRASNSNFALHCIDLDGFKEVNDTYGHAVGDQVLKIVGERIRDCLAPGDHAARLGGDEFAILQIKPLSNHEASTFARRLIASISTPCLINGAKVAVGVSIGIAIAPADGNDADKLLINADLALYRSKNAGKGTWHFFETGMDEEARERRTLEQDLRFAIERDQFSLMYQPVMDIKTGAFTQCEALLRWTHPERGAISPSVFIPLAEESGLIVAIGEWVIREACLSAMQWPSHMRVAVNLSAAQFQSPGLLPAIMRALNDSELAPNRLEIEITESVLVSNVDTVQSVLSAVARLGVRIALDDFGTGYSSLSYLRQIRFDKIKIDKSFVSEMLTDRSCASIIRVVIMLARDLDMRVTAEGIETDEQLKRLSEEGCDEAQGYLISPPLLNSQALKMLHPKQESAVA